MSTNINDVANFENATRFEMMLTTVCQVIKSASIKSVYVNGFDFRYIDNGNIVIVERSANHRTYVMNAGGHLDCDPDNDPQYFDLPRYL
jgi:hypothetical protein